ncbi:MinD/ParA family ATP-binding protein [Rhodococcoides corynebacterioides]|uniref:AAA family ATPase n=1 Tax=Rhodococcoides corynebacterioides TaxID=53972 RepID=A0ABS7P660_9NOCA|nr:AAA family ATPase [Rhodococcus corynebacterioides]MBY6367357.1 AAA family ATPase [Rhodococcus corynebacterioides]MBY6407681.1 AAA family ATPase [Rhodococcus corynebacterioides]
MTRFDPARFDETDGAWLPPESTPEPAPQPSPHPAPGPAHQNPGYQGAGYQGYGYQDPAHPGPGHTRSHGSAGIGSQGTGPRPGPVPSGSPSAPTGWRRAVDTMLGRRASAAEVRRRNLRERITQPVSGDYRIALLSLKGGVGKTTVTVGLGSVLASMRGDNVVAVDANPDFGTLGERVPRQTTSTVRDLLAARPWIRSYADIRLHTSQSSSRLEVVAGERDPAASEAFTDRDYRAVVETLCTHYGIVLTDCGTGIMHSAMDGVLSLAHALVLVSSPAVDGARSAAATLDWLGLHGYAHLVERTVVVVSANRPGAASIDMDELKRHFLARCRAVVVIPFDEHLAEGSVVELDRLRPRTRDAFVELAAMMADDFPAAGGRHAVPAAPDALRAW